MLDLTTEHVNQNKQVIQDLQLGKELAEKIAVTAPYFALQTIRANLHGELTAMFPVELKNHNELRGISLSEAGRHMAILGSLALAKANVRQEKHYYLATDAVFERLHNLPLNDDYCQGIVAVKELNKKEGSVCGRLICDGTVLYRVEIIYAIIHEKVFQRLFSAHSEIENAPMLGNPYAFQTRFFTEYISTKSCLASIGFVRREDCMGHFNGFPALPVARIGGAMVDLSGVHYNAIRNSNAEFCVRKAELHADNFIFAGDSVTIESIAGRGKLKNEISSVAHSSSHQNAISMNCIFF